MNLIRLFSISANIKFFNIGAGLITTILLSKVLQVKDFGTYAFILSMLTILTIPAVMGVPEVVVREVARISSTNKLEELNLLFKWIKKTILITSSFSIMIFLIFIFVYKKDVILKENVSLLFFLIICIPVMAVNSIRSSIIIGLNHVLLGQIIDNIVRPIILMLMLVFCYLLVVDYVSINTAILLYLISLLTAMICGLFLLKKKMPCMDNITEINEQGKYKEWTLSALPLALVSGIYIISQQVDILLLGLLSSFESIAIYKIAAQIGVFVIVGQQILRSILAPKFSVLWQKGDLQQLQRITIFSSRISCTIALLISFIFYFYGKFFLSYFFGENYLLAYEPLLILCFGQIINAACGSTGILLNMCGKEKESIKGLLVGLSVNIISGFILIPIYGVSGAAIGAALGAITWNLCLWLIVRKHIGIKPTAFGV
ncbi:oligosaccharide flippase family protein [Acinetobacter sp. YH12041]|uniref:oligosaccharide flippase family protein n=1 Tax=Acinetobacter sp. YH12041 TaxID=2601049 RepID=UPI00211E7650|nr:oligosaccharide flippase family protein [Acinetobacter sp. YH12041]